MYIMRDTSFKIEHFTYLWQNEMQNFEEHSTVREMFIAPTEVNTAENW